MSGLEKKLIPRKVLFGNPEKISCQLSPDGRWLSWLGPKDGVLNIWIAPLEAPQQAIALTDDSKRGIRFFLWAKDSAHVLYIQDVDGNEDWHLYRVNIETRDSRNLTPYEKCTVRFYASSWEMPDYMMVGMNDRDQRWHDLYCLNILTGKRDLVFQNTEHFNLFNFDRNMTLRFASKTIENEGGKIIYRYKNGHFDEFIRIGLDDELTTYLIGFEANSPLCYMLDSRKTDKICLTQLNWETGDTKHLAEHTRADIDDVLLHPTSYKLEAYSACYQEQEWHAFGSAIAQDLTLLQTELKGEIAVVSRTKANDIWIVAASSAQSPDVYYRYDRANQNLVKLFSSRPELDNTPLRPMQSHVIKARDGLDLVSYLTLPANAHATGETLPAAQSVPLVLLVHGGPWARDGYGYDPQHQLLANRGYAVLSVNFRGSTGFGKSFINAANNEWGGKMHDDLLDAVDWAIQQGITTKDKIAIMGGSYGGYATLVGLTFTPDVFACGVDIVGPSNLQTLIDTIPPYWRGFYEGLAKRMGDPRSEEGRQFLQERSPLNKADQIKKPLLIAQGANDPRVKQSESDQIVAAMKEKDIPVTYVLYPDEGHGFARPENRIAFQAIAEAFLSEHLGGSFEPIGEDFKGSSTQVPVGAEYVKGLKEGLNTKTS